MISVPGTSFFLAQSTLVLAPQLAWPDLQNKLSAMVHPADFWQSGEEGKPLSVAQVKSLRLFAERSPVGKYKIAWLEGADTFKAETSNALLKLLEEPPAYLYLVLASETNRVLPTIRSRVRELSLPDNSATLDADGTRFQGWKSVLAQYDVTDPDQRDLASQALYSQALAHSGIKPELFIRTK
jgi:hypothetical protein